MKDFNKIPKKRDIKRKISLLLGKNFSFLYKPALFLVSLQLIILGLFTYDNRYKINPKISQFINKEFINLLGLSVDTFEIKDYKEYFSDFLRSLISRKQLERIDINLSFKDKQKLECMRMMKENCTQDGWVRADLINKKDTYKIKLRSKGDRDIHRLKFNNMSFKVDIRGKERLFGMEEFSIQLPVIRNYTIEGVASNLLRAQDIASPRNFYVAFYINGEYLGVRHIEETISRELIESSKRRYGPVFTRPYAYDGFILNDKKVWIDDQSNIENEALTALQSSWGNPTLFNKYFDVDKWAKYMSILDLMMMIHGTVPKSVKYYLNPASGLIEPVFFDGHNGGWFHNYRLSDVLTKDNENLKWPNCTLTCEQHGYFRMMFGNSFDINIDFYEKYLNYLDYFSNEDFINNDLEYEWKKYWLARGTIYREFSRKDNITTFGIMPHIGGIEKLRKRFRQVKKEVNDAKLISPNHSHSLKNNVLEIENTRSRLPQIYTLYCLNKKVEKIVLIKNQKRKLDLKKFDNCSIKNLSFRLSNNLKRRYVWNETWIDKDLRDYILSNENAIGHNRNKVIIDENLKIINNNTYLNQKNIQIKDGSNLCIGNSSLLRISNSNVVFEGDLQDPILIKGCDKNSGSILIENSQISFNNIAFSGLKSPKLKLRKLYGGINFVNSKIIGNNMIVKNSLSEDGVNFINSEIVIKNLRFSKIQSDGLDSDFSKFKIGNVICVDVGNDCVDFSYSNGTITQLSATGIKDKSISLGESSNLNLDKVKVVNSEIGIAAKDLSTLFIDNYEVNNTIIPIASYIKKPELGKPIIKINKINLNNIDSEFMSKDSEVQIGGKQINGKNSSKEVVERLYGNEYGVKTQR